MRVLALAANDDADWSTHRAGVKPAFILQIALLLLTVANVGRIPVLDLGDRQAPILINDICVGAVLFVGAVYMVHKRSVRLDNVALVGLLFASMGALAAVAAIPRFGLSGIEIVASLAYLARWMWYFALYVVVINCVQAHDTEVLWTALERAMLLIAAFGIVQAIFLPNFASIVYPESREYIDWDPQKNRLVSTILEPNIAAAMIAMVLIVQLARAACGAPLALWKPVLMFAALAMTLSRSGFAALFVGGAVILAARGLSKRLVRIGAVIGVLFLPFLPKFISFGQAYRPFGVTDDSAYARVIAWQQAIAVFIENPWFGIGFNTYGFVQERRGFERIGGASYSVTGGLLSIAVMVGIAGLGVYLLMLYVAMRRMRKGWRSREATPSERGLLVGTAAATLAVIVHSVFVNSLLMPFVMEMLWVLWGLSFVVATSIARRSPLVA